MEGSLEVELKLELDPVALGKVDRDALFGVTRASDRLESVYFDTPGLDLRAAGFSLRVRKKGRQHIQTIKADAKAKAGLFVRPEWEHPIKGSTPIVDETAGPLTSMVGWKVLDALVRLFATDVRRTIHLHSERGATIEIAIDEGDVRAGERSEPLCEIELELKSGPSGVLFDIARRMNEVLPVRLGVRSKAERGYALVAGDAVTAFGNEPIILDPGDDAAHAFETIAHACLRQFRLNEALLLAGGGAEALHQARIGLRRLRSAFTLYKPLLAGDAKAQLLRGELKWLAAELGEVRNLDIVIDRVEAGEREPIMDARARIHDVVRAELESARTRILMIDLAEWLALGDWRVRPQDPAALHQPVRLLADGLLEKHRKRMKRRGRNFASLSDRGRHEVRIEAKALRYAAEFFAALYRDKKSRRRQKAFLKALEDLQDRLGALNDLVTAPQVIGKHGLDVKLPRIGRRERERMLHRAEGAFEAFMDMKRYWR